MKINNNQTYIPFKQKEDRLKRLEISDNTIFPISDKMHRIGHQIKKHCPKGSILKTEATTNKHFTKIYFYKETFTKRKSIIGKALNYFIGDKKQIITGAWVEVNHDLTEKELKGAIHKLISETKKVWKKK